MENLHYGQIVIGLICFVVWVNIDSAHFALHQLIIVNVTKTDDPAGRKKIK